jgi:hypothetical protein
MSISACAIPDGLGSEIQLVFEMVDIVDHIVRRGKNEPVWRAALIRHENVRAPERFSVTPPAFRTCCPHLTSLIDRFSFAKDGMSPPQPQLDAGANPTSWIAANRNGDLAEGATTSATTPSNAGSSEQQSPPAKRRREERERTRVSRACDRCKK